GLPQSSWAAGAPAATKPCRVVRAVSLNANGPAPNETRSARATHGTASGHANDRTAGTHATKFPALRLLHPRYFAGRRAPRDRQAVHTPRGALRTRAACQPGLPRAPAPPPCHARPQGRRTCYLVGPEPAPAFAILREILTSAFCLQLARRRHLKIGSLRDGLSSHRSIPGQIPSRPK